MRLRETPRRKITNPAQASTLYLDDQIHAGCERYRSLANERNRSRRGWSNYFGYVSRSKAYRSVDRVRRFLARRHKVQGRGNRRFTFDVIHRELGVGLISGDKSCRAFPRSVLFRERSEQDPLLPTRFQPSSLPCVDTVELSVRERSRQAQQPKVGSSHLP